MLQFLASYQSHPRYMWLEEVEDDYTVVGLHYKGRNNAVLSQRVSKLNFQRLVERFRGGSPATDTYTYTKRLVAFLLTRCLEDWGSSEIERSDYLPPGFSNLVPFGFEMDMKCHAPASTTYNKCNYGQIFDRLEINTDLWPTNFRGVNPSLAVTALDIRPEAAFLYWLRERDLGDIGAHVEDTSPPTCTTPEEDHAEDGQTACTAEIPLVNEGEEDEAADLDACLDLATDARADLSQWPNPPATVTCCVGDCDCKGTVVVNELITSVNVALGLTSVNSCLPIDFNISDTATVNELILAVRGALNPPCSAPSGGGGGGAPAGGGAPPSATLDVPNAGGSRGQSVTLNLTLSTSGGSAAAAQLDLSYVSTVFSAGNVSSSWDPAASVSNCTLGSTLDPAKHQIAVSDSPAVGSSRRLRVSVLPKFSGTIQNLPNGTIASCTFQIATNAPVGTHVMFLTEPGVSDAFGDAVAATARFATVVQVCEGCNCG